MLVAGVAQSVRLAEPHPRPQLQQQLPRTSGQVRSNLSVRVPAQCFRRSRSARSVEALDVRRSY